MLRGRPCLRYGWPEVCARTDGRHQAQAPTDPRDERTDVPDALAVLVLRLLAKRPGDRPEGAQTVARELRNMQFVR
jgi:hypothetical protein